MPFEWAPALLKSQFDLTGPRTGIDSYHDHIAALLPEWFDAPYVEDRMTMKDKLEGGREMALWTYLVDTTLRHLRLYFSNHEDAVYARLLL